ncbi:hypothetical protein [Clostridiisalibacter paucivorans]|uniref:hypothetical protein n=1 Tax=Clostridiisalibacter paucivorans TaxID=408753 RepID=UPI000684462F|nr:hypothetical protein [Clostridiisalibacter paucivorans]
MFKYIIGIIFFALATMILYSWGYVKEQRMPVVLMNKLNKKAEEKIIKALKNKGGMTKKEIVQILSGIKVSEFGTRKSLVVKDSKALTKNVLKKLIDDGIIKVDYTERPNKYVFLEKE